MSKSTIKSIVIMGLSSVIGYLMTMFLTSYITENVGIEAYGFVSIAKTFVDYGGILTIALTSFTVRYITISYHKNDLKEANSYYVSSINAGIFLCFFLMIVFLCLVFNLEYLINIPTSLIHSVRILFLVVFAAFIAQTLSTPFSAAFYIRDRLDISGIIKIISYLVEIIILIVLFSFFMPSVVFVGVGLLVASLTVLIGTYIFNRKLIPDFRYNIKLHSNQKIVIILKNGLWNSVNQLGNVLNSGLDLLVSNAMLTGVQTGQIAVAKSIGAIFSTLSGVIFQPLQPELLRTFSEGVNNDFLNQIKKSMKLCGFFGSLAFSGFFSIGLLFYKLWLPAQDSNLLHILTLLTVFTYIMDIFLQPIYYVSTLTVRNKIPCFITISGGLFNVLGMYLLIKYTGLGVYSVPITTAVIMFCINFFFNPIYACWCLKIEKFYFYPLILRHLFASVMMCVAFKIISLLLAPSGWAGLIISALIMSIFGIFIYVLITFKKTERRELIFRVKKVISNMRAR